MRDSMIIYRSFFEAIKSLPLEEQAITWNALFEYGLNFNESNLQGISSTIFSLIRPQLDANLRRYENGRKPKIKAKQKQKRSKSETNVNVNVNDNDNVNENENKNKPAAFVPPSLAEVISFFTDNGYSQDSAIKAHQYYSDGLWRDSSGKKIISWKQKMRGIWFREENRAKSGATYSRNGSYNPAR